MERAARQGVNVTTAERQWGHRQPGESGGGWASAEWSSWLPEQWRRSIWRLTGQKASVPAQDDRSPSMRCYLIRCAAIRALGHETAVVFRTSIPPSHRPCLSQLGDIQTGSALQYPVPIQVVCKGFTPAHISNCNSWTSHQSLSAMAAKPN